MRKFKQLLLLVISITLVSCHTTGSIKQKAWKVQQGMTTEEIGQLLGKPDFRRFDGSLEQWEYQSGGIATSCKFLIIEFRNGKVTSNNSCLNFLIYLCFCVLFRLNYHWLVIPNILRASSCVNKESSVLMISFPFSRSTMRLEIILNTFIFSSSHVNMDMSRAVCLQVK
jgi:hypothetical protein